MNAWGKLFRSIVVCITLRCGAPKPTELARGAIHAGQSGANWSHVELAGLACSRPSSTTSTWLAKLSERPLEALSWCLQLVARALVAWVPADHEHYILSVDQHLEEHRDPPPKERRSKNPEALHNFLVKNTKKQGGTKWALPLACGLLIWKHKGIEHRWPIVLRFLLPTQYIATNHHAMYTQAMDAVGISATLSADAGFSYRSILTAWLGEGRRFVIRVAFRRSGWQFFYDVQGKRHKVTTYMRRFAERKPLPPPFIVKVRGTPVLRSRRIKSLRGRFWPDGPLVNITFVAAYVVVNGKLVFSEQHCHVYVSHKGLSGEAARQVFRMRWPVEVYFRQGRDDRPDWRAHNRNRFELYIGLHMLRTALGLLIQATMTGQGIEELGKHKVGRFGIPLVTRSLLHHHEHGRVVRKHAPDPPPIPIDDAVRESTQRWLMLQQD